MSVAFDNATPDVTTQSTAITVGHTPVGTPRGVAVTVIEENATKTITGVTYGGTAMTEMTNSPAESVGAEVCAISKWFLGASVPTGAQNAVVSLSGNITRQVVVITVTAAADTEVNIDSVLINSGSTSTETATLALSSIESFVFNPFFSGALGSGDNSPQSGWTDRGEVDFGPSTGGVYTYDTIGTADVLCGYTRGGGADDCIVYASAIQESVAAGGRTMGSLAGQGGLAGMGGIAGQGGGIAG